MKTLRLLIMSVLALMLTTSCSSDETFEPSAGVQPNRSFMAGGDGVLRVLAIGNSFSQDAMELYLLSICEGQGIEVELGDARISSSSLEQHARNAKWDVPGYTYWHTQSGQGNATVDEGLTLDFILKSSAWDIVTIQQFSKLSGQYDSYVTWTPFLVSYIRDRVPCDARVLLHQAWTYESSTSAAGYSKLHDDTRLKDQAVVKSTERAVAEYDLDGIIPTCTAIASARRAYPDVDFTRDGHHLNPLWGCYVASATWYEALTGEDARLIKYAPNDLDSDFAAGLRDCAHRANAGISNK